MSEEFHSKVEYITLDGYTTKAYLDKELDEFVWSGINKHTDEPVTVRWNPIEEVWREVDVTPIEGKVMSEEEINEQVAEFAEMLEKPASVYICPDCKMEIPRGLDNLMRHKKVGGDCEIASSLRISASQDEYEEALLTKANMEQISKRSGKSMSELNVMRKTLLSMGHGMRIKYKVVKTDG